jgi:hypothetical protein
VAHDNHFGSLPARQKVHFAPYADRAMIADRLKPTFGAFRGGRSGGAGVAGVGAYRGRGRGWGLGVVTAGVGGYCGVGRWGWLVGEGLG